MKHFIQRGSCIYCHKPVDFMKGFQKGDRGWVFLPPKEEQEDCERKEAGEGSHE